MAPGIAFSGGLRSAEGGVFCPFLADVCAALLFQGMCDILSPAFWTELERDERPRPKPKLLVRTGACPSGTSRAAASPMLDARFFGKVGSSSLGSPGVVEDTTGELFRVVKTGCLRFMMYFEVVSGVVFLVEERERERCANRCS